jgi:hypothetical protein
LINASRIELVTKSLLITSGEEPSPRGTAHNAGDISIGEANAVLCDTVDVRCRDILAPLKAEIAVAEIVSDDDDNVRLCSRLSASISCKQRRSVCRHER